MKKCVKISLIYIAILSVLLVGIAYIYRLPSFANFFNERFENTEFDTTKFLEDCYKKQCSQLEEEFKKQCDGMRLKCADQHLYDYQKCNQEVMTACNSNKLQTCLNTCKDLAEIEKRNQVAIQEQARKALPPSGKYLLEEEVDLSKGSRTLPSPEINRYVTPEYSVGFFIRVEKPSNNHRTLLHNTNRYYYRCPGIWIDSGNDLRILSIHSVSRSGSHLGYNRRLYTYSPVKAMMFGKRHHIGVTVSNNKMTLYIDGQKVDEITLQVGIMFVWPPFNTGSVFYLRHPFEGVTHNGYLKVSDVYWSQVALTHEQMAVLANKYT